MRTTLILLSSLLISCSSFINTDDERDRAAAANALIELVALKPTPEEIDYKIFGGQNRLDKWAKKWERVHMEVLVSQQDKSKNEY